MPHAGLPSAPSGAAVNGHAEEAAADEKEEEDHHDGDGADEPMADTEEADAVPSHKAAEQEQGANPEDRYDGTDAGQQNCGDRWHSNKLCSMHQSWSLIRYHSAGGASPCSELVCCVGRRSLRKMLEMTMKLTLEMRN